MPYIILISLKKLTLFFIELWSLVVSEIKNVQIAKIVENIFINEISLTKNYFFEF